MSELSEVGKGFAGWAEENSGLAVDENFEYTDRTVGNFAAAAFAAGAEWQAEQPVTDAQIEAAAEALVSTELNFDETMFSPSEVHEIWENRSFANREELRRKIRLALEAARKAVSDE